MIFSADGRAALHHALREAGRLGHESLGPEHLLLGLLAADNPAAEGLPAAGVKQCPINPLGSWGRLPRTAELDAVLATAHAAAGDAAVGSRHLLTALAGAPGIAGELAAGTRHAW